MSGWHVMNPISYLGVIETAGVIIGMEGATVTAIVTATEIVTVTVTVTVIETAVGTVTVTAAEIAIVIVTATGIGIAIGITTTGTMTGIGTAATMEGHVTTITIARAGILTRITTIVTAAVTMMILEAGASILTTGLEAGVHHEITMAPSNDKKTNFHPFLFSPQ